MPLVFKIQDPLYTIMSVFQKLEFRRWIFRRDFVFVISRIWSKRGFGEGSHRAPTTGERLWRRRQYCQGLKTRYCRVGLLQTAQPVKILALDTFCRSLNKQNKVRLFFWIKDLIKCKNLIAQAACCGLVGQYRILQPLLPSATPFYLKPFWWHEINNIG